MEASANWACRIPFAIEVEFRAAVAPIADVVANPLVEICDQPQAEANARLIAESPSLHAIAESVLTALRYPRGSEAQVRAFDEIGQDAQAVLARVAGATP